MSRDKQIDEMAECLIDIQQNFNEYCAKPCRECELGGIVNCENHYKAEALYKAGYRKQEWISVDERLPEDDGFVLLCTSKGSIIKGHYEHKYGRWSGLNNRLNVTHWMPLPEAPKMKGGAECT